MIEFFYTQQITRIKKAALDVLHLINYNVGQKHIQQNIFEENYICNFMNLKDYTKIKKYAAWLITIHLKHLMLFYFKNVAFFIEEKNIFIHVSEYF